MALKTVKLEPETQEKVEGTVTADSDLTGDTVEWSFPLTGERPTTWDAGSWDGSATEDASTAPSTWSQVTASPLIGASGATVELATGVTYDAYVRITDVPEIPVRRIGKVRIL